MKLIVTNLLVALAISVAFASPVHAKPKLVVTYPYIASLVQQIAKGEATVTTLAKGDEDPHFVVPRPSFIGKLRQADLLIINGASLEIGFVPPLIKQANNPKVMPGGPGLVDLSQAVTLIEKPSNVSRSEGDIHPDGNPHFVLDWHNIPAVAKMIADALARTEPSAASSYRANLDAFLAKWKTKSEEWDRRATALRGKSIIQYHRLYDYFAERTGLKIVGELEPKPGIPPTSRHIEALIAANPPGSILKVVTDPYHEQKTAQGIAQKIGVAWVVLPQDVEGVPGAQDVFGLFDTLLGSILK
jgi:zinc/manganese transport system substrate-binding protein